MKSKKTTKKVAKPKPSVKRKSLHERLKERAMLEENDKSLNDESEEDTDTEREIDEGMDDVDLGPSNGHFEDDLQGEEDDEDEDY
jgi:hypothetical protein